MLTSSPVRLHAARPDGVVRCLKKPPEHDNQATRDNGAQRPARLTDLRRWLEEAGIVGAVVEPEQGFAVFRGRGLQSE